MHMQVEGSSYMFLTGPDVVRTVTMESVTQEELGGAATHTSRSGVAHGAWPNELEALAGLRSLLSFLPSSNRQPAPLVRNLSSTHQLCCVATWAFKDLSGCIKV